jgi:hypothetical protein
MKTFALPHALTAFLLTSSLLPAAQPELRPAGPAVVVYLQSGRTFAGNVDPQTDEREFILRSQVGDGLIFRPIHWERLVHAEIVGESISGPELHRVVTEIRQAAQPPAPRPPRPAPDTISARSF